MQAAIIKHCGWDFFVKRGLFQEICIDDCQWEVRLTMMGGVQMYPLS